MNEIIKNYNGANIRIAGTPENPLFCAADVCAVLELENNRRATSSLDADELVLLKVTSGGQQREMLHVTESGLYALIFKSRKAAAKKFSKWVTSEVLPEIRKNGFYLPTAKKHFGSESTQDVFNVVRELVAMGCSPDAACNSVRLHVYQKSTPQSFTPLKREAAIDTPIDIPLDCTWKEALDRLVTLRGMSVKMATHAMARASAKGSIVCPARDGVWKHKQS